MPEFWISPRDLDAAGSARELPVYSGTFTATGEPDGCYPARVGMASASVGRVAFNGATYTTRNLGAKHGRLFFLALEPAHA